MGVNRLSFSWVPFKFDLKEHKAPLSLKLTQLNDTVQRTTHLYPLSVKSGENPYKMNSEVMYLRDMGVTTMSRSQFSFAEEVAAQARKRTNPSLRHMEDVIVETLPPLELRNEWRNQQALARQTTHNPPPTKGFKAGTWGKGRSNKRTIMDIWSLKGKYMLSTYKADAPEQISTRSEKRMKEVCVGDTLHMVSCDRTVHYKGIVQSEFRGMPRAELFTKYKDIKQAGWGEADPNERDNHFKVCDVKWTQQHLTPENKIYLCNTPQDGGGRIGNIRATLCRLA